MNRTKQRVLDHTRAMILHGKHVCVRLNVAGENAYSENAIPPTNVSRFQVSVPRFCLSFVIGFLCCTTLRADLVFTLDNSQKSSDDAGGLAFADVQLNLSATTNSIYADGSALLIASDTIVNNTSGTFADSLLDLSFVSTSDSNFDLAVSLFSFVDLDTFGVPLGTSFSSLSLTGQGVNISIFDPQPNFSTSGQFLAGEQYHLIAHARVDQGTFDASGGSQFLVTLTAPTAVPEPSSLIGMAALGSLTLIRYLRRSCPKN